MEKLKKCPFCGGEAKVYEGEQDFLIYKEKCFNVFCENCHCSTEYKKENTEAIEAWNGRCCE